jgi:hypothetical protein
MSSQYSYEENERLSQRACHLLTGYLPSATKITFDDSDDEGEENAKTIILAPPPSKVINIARLIKEIFGPNGDDEEEVDYYQQSKGLLEYYETHSTRAMAIEAIHRNQQHRRGEKDYGAGVSCDNTVCFRDYTDNYFQRVFVEEGIYQTLCPDCIPDEEETQEDQEEHCDKRVKIVLDK